MKMKNYFKMTKQNLEKEAKKMIGQSFYDLIKNNSHNQQIFHNNLKKYTQSKNKGILGIIVEEMYFGFQRNTSSEADFKQVGVELKVSPYELIKDKTKVAERLVLSKINFNKTVEVDFFQSHLWKKINTLLLVYYLRDKSIINNLQYLINYVTLFSPSDTDLKIITQDYQKIISKIRSGKAHELSESDTMYLGACTKGATAAKSLTKQFYNPKQLAKSRAFSFKRSYMDTVLQNIISKTKDPVLITNDQVLHHKTFEEYILDKLNQNANQKTEVLLQKYDLKNTRDKANLTRLCFHILGINSNQANEFKKANIVLKTIRLNHNQINQEALSLPTFEFKKIITENWEDSCLHNYFEETKFLFVVFNQKNKIQYLQKAFFWNMPQKDLNGPVQDCWKKTISTIKKGIIFTHKNNKIYNNLPKESSNSLIHVRPHSKISAYKLNDGTIIHDYHKYGSQLPDGQWMTKQSFWLNRSYSHSIVAGGLSVIS